MYRFVFRHRLETARRRLARLGCAPRERVDALLDELTHVEAMGHDDARAERGLQHVEELLSTLEEDSTLRPRRQETP